MVHGSLDLRESGVESRESGIGNREKNTRKNFCPKGYNGVYPFRDTSLTFARSDISIPLDGTQRLTFDFILPSHLYRLKQQIKSLLPIT
jgi:hypothetical protein